MIKDANTQDSSEPQPSTPTGSDTGPATSIPETPASSNIVVAPDFGYVEMGEPPLETIEIDFEVKTGLE